MPLDTHRLIRRMTQAGLSEPQAEVVMDVVSESHQTQFDTLATKADLAELRSELRGEMAELRGEMAGLRTEFAGLRTEFSGLRTEFSGKLETAIHRLEASSARDKADILKWMVGMILVQGGVAIGVLKLLPVH